MCTWGGKCHVIYSICNQYKQGEATFLQREEGGAARSLTGVFVQPSLSCFLVDGKDVLFVFSWVSVYV